MDFETIATQGILTLIGVVSVVVPGIIAVVAGFQAINVILAVLKNASGPNIERHSSSDAFIEEYERDAETMSWDELNDKYSNMETAGNPSYEERADTFDSGRSSKEKDPWD